MNLKFTEMKLDYYINRILWYYSIYHDNTLIYQSRYAIQNHLDNLIQLSTKLLQGKI